MQLNEHKFIDKNKKFYPEAHGMVHMLTKYEQHVCKWKVLMHVCSVWALFCW